MSVRRLAEGSVQPPSFAFNRANASWAKNKLKDYPEGRQASAVIPLLMRAQEQGGWVTRAAIEHVAEMLDMPLIRVLEVATFYTQFQLAPVGTKAHVQVCGTTPCMLRGAGDLIETCKRVIGPKPFETTADGKLSWEEVECQGACVNAPMVMIFKDTYEDLTPKQLEDIIYRFEVGNGKSVTPGPQVDRIYSAPEGGLTSLNGVAPKAKKAAPKAAAKSVSKKAKPAAKKASAAKAKPATKKVAAKPATSVSKAKPAPKTVAKKPAKTAAPKKPFARVKAVSKAGPKVVKKDAGKPTGMKKPAKPDDLKLISGVGPKIEGILNGLGVYKFAQVGQWKTAERDWVDDYLSFKGRIERDEWVKQAKKLAKGGAK